MTKAKREAFLKMYQTGKAEQEKFIIFELLSARPRNLTELKSLLNKADKNAFNGRLTDLKELGFIAEIQGEKETIYCIDARENWEQNAINYAKEKFERWIRQGQKNNYFEMIKSN